MLQTIMINMVLIVSTLSSESSKTTSKSRKIQTKSSATLSVKTTVLCAERGASVKISCALTRNDARQLHNEWMVWWLSDGKITRTHVRKKSKNDSVLVSHLYVHVTWADKKIFTCVGRRLKEWIKSEYFTSSVIVQAKPKATRITGLHFFENEFGKTVEVHWRPRDINTTSYTLTYCVEDTDDVFSPACPHYQSVKAKCVVRGRDYTRVENTTGLICKAMFHQMASVYTVHKAYVTSQRDECKSKGPETRFYLSYWQDSSSFSNTTELVMVPHPITKLRIMTTKERIVQLNWSDPWFVYGQNARDYTVRYRCSKSSTWTTKQCSQTKISLRSTDIPVYHPYDICRFCITAKPFNNGMDSEAVCLDARLHEEVPTGAPTVTCDGHECKSTRNGPERNVTITWTLPPPEVWNGVLRKLKVTYKSSFKRSRVKEVSLGNLTNGETVLKRLAINQSYIVRMMACNDAGCGGLGNATTIPELSRLYAGGNSSQESQEGSTWLVSLSSIGGIALLSLFIFLACATRQRLQTSRKNGLRPQPCICEPPSYEYVIKEPSANTEEYDVLSWQNDKNMNFSVTCVKDLEYEPDQWKTV